MRICTKTIFTVPQFGAQSRLLRCGVSHSAVALSLAIAALSLASTEAQAQSITYADGEVRNTGVTAPTTLTVGAGASATQSGAITGTGATTKAGDGTLILTGANSSVSTVISGGALRVSNGGTVTNTGALSLTGANASLTISGAGSTLTVRSPINTIGSAAGVTMTVENSGKFLNTSGNVDLGHAAGTKATLNVIGAGSLFDAKTAIRSKQGDATYNVIGGGQILNTGGMFLGADSSSAGSGHTTILISGAGSRWDGGFGTFGDVKLTILDGGVMTVASLAAGHLNGKTSNMLISGTGSQFIVGTNAGAVKFGGDGTGIITVADGGKFAVTGTAPVLTINKGGTINIGGAVGGPAAAAGTVEADLITFGAGAGALNFNHTDSDYVFDVPLASVGAGDGRINQTGSGTTRLEGDSSAFAGLTTVQAGTLSVNGILGGTMDVFGGRLQGNGTVGNTINHLGGVIAPGNSIGTLTIAGNYTSNGGALEIEAELGTDSSPTDLLVVTGDTILGSGTTLVRVINVGGAGGQTAGDGIKIIEVGGVSAAEAFALSGPAIGGAYRYDLFQNDLTGTLDDGNWYLRSTGLAPTLPVYENHPQVLLGMVALPTLQQRVGNRYRSMLGGVAGNAAGAGQNAIWTRIEGAHGRIKSKASTADASYDSDTSLVQVGLDGQLSANANGMLIGGLTARYSRATADVFSSLGDGGNATTSFGIGATLTWYGENGFYVDGQAQIATLHSDLTAAGIGTIGDGIHGSGQALSLEAGRKTALGGGWSLTPQAQLAYASVDFDAFTDRFGTNVSLKKGDSLKGRVGISAGYEADAGTHVYGITNLTYEFLDGTAVAVSGVDLAFAPQRFGGELGVGGTYAWAGGKYALHGEALASTSFQGSRSLKGTVGFTAGF